MQNQFLPSEIATETTPYSAPSITSSLTASAQISSTQVIISAQAATSEQAITDLLKQMQRWVMRRKKRMRLSIFLYSMFCIYAFFYYSVSGLHRWLEAHKILEYLLVLPGGYGFYSIVALASVEADSDIDLLTQAAGKKAIPALLDALSFNGLPAYSKLYSLALITLLPQLQAADAALLTPSHRHYLNSLLRWEFLTIAAVGPEDALVVAILKAYEQVGDTKAIPYVKRLVGMKARSNRQRVLQQAAQECLPLLRVNASGIDVTKTLLRASMPDTNTPEILLRPVISATTTSDAELLRAATDDALPRA